MPSGSGPEGVRAASGPARGPARARAILPRLLLGSVLLLGLALLVDATVGWSAVLEPWRSITASLVGLLAALLTLANGLRGVRIWVLLRRRVPLVECLELTALHTAAVNWLPMRLGELVYPILLRGRAELSFWKAAGSLLWLRLFDLGVVATAAFAWAALAFATDLGAWRALAWLLLPLPLLGLLLGQALRLRLGAAPGHRAGTSRPRWLRPVIDAGPDGWGVFTVLVGLSATLWAAKLAAFVALVMALHGVPAATALLGALGAEAASFLPVQGLAGAGTFEGGATSLLMLGGLPFEPALAAAVNLHLLVLAFSLLLAGVALATRALRPRSPAPVSPLSTDAEP